MRLELAEDSLFIHSAEKKRLVDADPPRSQCGHYTLVSWRISRRHNRGANDQLVLSVTFCLQNLALLNPANLRQQPLERSWVVRLQRPLDFGLLKTVEPVDLIDAFSLVIGEDAIEVEGNAKFAIVRIVGIRRREHAARRQSVHDGSSHACLVSGQEQRCVE